MCVPRSYSVSEWRMHAAKTCESNLGPCSPCWSQWNAIVRAEFGISELPDVASRNRVITCWWKPYYSLAIYYQCFGGKFQGAARFDLFAISGFHIGSQRPWSHKSWILVFIPLLPFRHVRTWILLETVAVGAKAMCTQELRHEMATDVEEKYI